MKNFATFKDLQDQFGPELVGEEDDWESSPADNGIHWVHRSGISRGVDGEAFWGDYPYNFIDAIDTSLQQTVLFNDLTILSVEIEDGLVIIGPRSSISIHDVLYK